jgi:hypothetical protein
MIHSIKEAIQRIESILELQNKLAYDHFTTPQQLPYACYIYDYETKGADDYTGISWVDFTLELYSESRDIPLEHKILIVFDDMELKSSCVYIESERMYQTSFRFRFPQKLTNTNP